MEIKQYLADESVSNAFAQSFAACLSAPTVIYLIGELGAGKTFFTRGVLRALGYEDAVKSPTYTLVESYQLPQATLHHFDLYRITDAEELEFIGLDQYFGDDTLVFIEWPARGEPLLPAADIKLEFHYRDKGREVSVETLTPHGEKMLEKFER